MLEKKGVKLGGFAPVMGTAIRTFFSLILLIFLSFPFLGQIKTAGLKPLGLIALGGGLLSGCLGIVFLYAGLKSGSLGPVMTIAFCLAPVLGSVLGYFVLGEKLVPVQLIGILLCAGGAAMTVYGRG
jgi:uncharacterized membrane protein